ncbi:TCP-1/cpn60 chaperonin family protein [Prunus dulcis]|uniref:TCP-1/cpn60 chaperonin family protein n=1 Tax=Prunus dulcis TaxID=3755 RepID=A0A4Y1R7L0_PRUDU|nr:TCP-1/cpn60 chaperonin family protein [Prunus dulcis]
MSLRVLNPNAEVLNKSAALHMNINAAKGLQDVLKTNLGPKGTIKMLVGGAGDIKLTKDGNTLLKEMQIQNPTAIMIARTAVAQDDISGDGTTSTVLFIGELMKQSERYIDEGMHPRVLVDGFEIAKRATLQFIEKFKTPVVMGNEPDKEILKMVARTTLRTKLYEALADQLTDIVVNSVLCIRKPEESIDLFMVGDYAHATQVEGLVLDHGSRHPDMKRWAENCYILTSNVSLEYEKRMSLWPNDHTIAQIKDAVRDGLRAVKNTIEDEAVILGAGAFEVAARQHLVNEVKKTVQGRAQLGVEAFADALLVVPKTLAENSGLDTQDVIIALTGEHDRGNVVGLNHHTGEPIDPQMEGIFDNYSVKRQIINSGPVIASQLLLVDEVIRAGRNMRKPT